MKKAKAKKAAPKKKLSHNHTGNGVFWYGIHIHHIGLGVASVGTLVLVTLLKQSGAL